MRKNLSKCIMVFLVSIGFFAFLSVSAAAQSSSFFERMRASFSVPKNYFIPAWHIVRGSSRVTQNAAADFRSALNQFLSFSLGNSFNRKSLSPEEALRIRRQNEAESENALPFTSENAELNVNAQSLFKEQTQFRKDILLQGDLFAEGRRVELGGGTLSASNVLYGILGGDGIVVSGSAQRPTISAAEQSEQSWKLTDTVLSPQLENATVSIGGELQLEDILTFTNDASIVYQGRSVTQIATNIADAWNISTSAESLPLISLGSIGSDTVSFGTKSSRAFVTIAGAEGKDRLFVGTGDEPDFFIGADGDVGIGTNDPTETLSVSGSFAVTGASLFGAEATFGVAPRFTSILNCVGNGALVTDTDGRVACGGFIFKTTPQFLSVTGCQGGGTLATDANGRLICDEDDRGGGRSAPGGPLTAIQVNTLGGFSGSADFTFDDSTDELTVAGFLTANGAGTSTYTGGIFSNALRTNLPSCDSLDTDSSGAIVCGADASGGGADGGNEVFEVLNNVSIYATSTGPSGSLGFFVRGEKSATTTGDLFEVAGDATIYDELTLTTIYATGTIHAFDFFATSSDASFYASSTVQGATLFAYTSLGIGGTTSPAYPFSLDGKALFDSSEIRLGTTSADRLHINIYTSSTTTIPDNTVGSFNIATSTGTQSSPILSITTQTGLRATTTARGALLIDGGAFAYNSYQGVTYADSFQAGPMAFDTDAGILSWVNMPISTTTTGIVQSYSAQINETDILTIYSETGGGGSVHNRFVGIGSSTPWGTFSVEQATTTPTDKPVFVVGDEGTSTPHLIVTGKGWVGSGTTTPWGSFSIEQLDGIYSSFVVGDSGTSSAHFIINGKGWVGIGTSTPGHGLAIATTTIIHGDAQSNLFVNNGAICADAGDVDMCSSAIGMVAGNIYADGSTLTGVDVAENYPVKEEEILEPGDVVTVVASARLAEAPAKRDSISTTTSAFAIKKAEPGDTILGVVSTKPGLTLGFGIATSSPVALSGRVPVKVNLDGGEIEIGDYITLSSEDGIAAKATSSGATIGIALEPFDGNSDQRDGSLVYSATGMIQIFVNLGYAKLDNAIAAGNISGDMLIDQETGTFMTADGMLNMDGNDITNARRILSANGTWSIDENGNLKVATIEAQKVKTEQLEVGSSARPFGATLYDVENGQPYCAYIKAGALETISGTCEANSNLFSGSSRNGSGSSGSSPTQNPPANDSFPADNSQTNNNTTTDSEPVGEEPAPEESSPPPLDEIESEPPADSIPDATTISMSEEPPAIDELLPQTTESSPRR